MSADEPMGFREIGPVDKMSRRIMRSLARRCRKRNWHYSEHDQHLRGRLVRLLDMRYPWYDWGHRALVLFGDCEGGNYGDPKPETWWYRRGECKRMWRTNYPRYPLSTFEVITDYATFKKRTEGLNGDQMDEWQAIYVDQDGELCLGHRWWGGAFYGMREDEVALLRRYLRRWRRHTWWGLRSWICCQALHAAVHCKKPGSCQAVPPKGSGGYSHWHCQLKRNHDGLHRFNNMTWGEIDGMDLGGVIHHPVENRHAK